MTGIDLFMGLENTPPHQDRKLRKQPGACLTMSMFAIAVAKACVKADVPLPHAPDKTRTQSGFVRSLASWPPVALGRAQADVTQLYAERDLAPAQKFAPLIG
jgi:hypothetical protein